MPDMVDVNISATDLAFTPAHPVMGDTVALTITAHNAGIVQTGPFNLALYDGDPNAGGTLLQTYAVSSIQGDGSATLTYPFTASPQTYRFYAIADTENVVTEMYEDNNTAIRSLKIKAPGEVLGPDLVPVKIDLDSMTTGTNLAVSGAAYVTFQNKGDDRINTSFNVLVFEDTDLDGKYTAGVDNLISTATNTISLWPEGASMLSVPLSGTVKFLHSPLYALIDSGDAILEQDETNNLIRSGADCSTPRGD
jgi:subtilase family serine protease